MDPATGRCFLIKDLEQMPNVRWKDDPKEYNRQWMRENRDKRNEHVRNSYHKEIKHRFEEDRVVAINHYGGRCVSCGYDNVHALCFDHINDDGQERRRKGERGGARFGRWLIKNGFPDDIQILCHNCNYLKKSGKLWTVKNF